MGASETKDERVDIYYELTKPFYYAGEYIQGSVYLNVRNDTEYSALYVKLQGREHCQWSEGSRKHRRHYTGDLKTFDNEFILANFQPGLRLGQYTFPFSMRTSPQFSGSFMQAFGRIARITYNLKAYLADYSGKNQPQQYSYNLTILEPPRMLSGMVVGKSAVNPQVCCCVQQGTTALDVNYSQNVVRGGGVVGVNVKVDNKMCKLPVAYGKVQLKKNVFVQSNSGVHRNWQTLLSEQLTPEVPAGSQNSFNFQIPIPAVNYPTAIGRIVANSYSIEVESELSGCTCCEPNPKTMAHIYIESPNPAVEVKPKISPPPNWNPVIAPKKVYDVQPEYMYAQNPNLAAMNRITMR